MICQRAIVNTFLAGEQNAQQTWYDAVTGTPLTGLAITGMWWAYACPDGLLLGGSLPEIVIVADEVPSAGLALGASTPALAITTTLGVEQAGLLIGSSVPALTISTLLAITPAGLLLGAYVARRVGGDTLIGVVCVSASLVDPGEESYALTDVACETTELVGVA